MPEEEKPKIFVDEDWKAKVEREREEARKTTEEKPADAAAEVAQAPEAGRPAEAGQAETREQGAPEGPSFFSLVSDLAAQAMFALGVIAPQGSKEVMVDLAGAKYVIDTLMVLREKTKGNLEAEEEGHLREALSELQRIYVARAQQVQQAQMQQSGVDPSNLKTKD